MKRVPDLLRALLLSPELLCAVLPFVVLHYVPSIGDVLLKPMRESISFGLAAAALPLGMLAFNYKESLELLSPDGQAKVLLEWPDYPMLKNRVLIALGWCTAGLVACGLSVWMIASDFRLDMAIALLSAGVLSSGAATATIGMARFRLRELLAHP
jgi:hypothetical protein